MRIALGCAEGLEAGALPPHPHPPFEKAGENRPVALGTTEGLLPASRPSGAARLVSFMGSACRGAQPLNIMGRRTAPGPAGGAAAFGGPPARQTKAPGGRRPPGALWALRAPAAPPRVPALSAGAGVNPRGESVLTGGEKAPGLSRGRRRWPGSAGPGIGRCDSRRKPRGGSGWQGGW